MNLPKRLEELVHDISSIRAGKTFAPSHYIEPVLTAIEQDIDKRLPKKKTWDTSVAGYSRNDDYKKGTSYNQALEDVRTKLHQYIRGDE